MSEKIVEGIWDCPYCGTTAIGGLTKHCPNCGHPQDKDTKFRIGEEKRYLTDEELARVGGEPDWACDYCDSLNNAEFIYCKNCGQPREKENKDYFELRKEEKKKAGSKNKSESESHKVEIEKRCETVCNTQIDNEKQHFRHFDFFRKYKGPLIASFVIVIATIFLILGISSIFTPKQYEGVIAEKSWERSVEIEEYKTFRESGWSLPAQARLAYSSTEIRSYNQVFDHYEERSRQVSYQVQDGYDVTYSDNGNGTFTEHQTPKYRTEYRTEYYQEPIYRSEPVYDTKYYYDIDRWVYGRSVDTSGSEDDPYWGDVTLQKKEREGQKNEVYKVFVEVRKKDKSKIYTYSCPQSEWETYPAGTNVQITVTAGILTNVEKNKE